MWPLIDWVIDAFSGKKLKQIVTKQVVCVYVCGTCPHQGEGYPMVQYYEQPTPMLLHKVWTTYSYATEWDSFKPKVYTLKECFDQIYVKFMVCLYIKRCQNWTPVSRILSGGHYVCMGTLWLIWFWKGPWMNVIAGILLRFLIYCLYKPYSSIYLWRYV